MKDLLNKVDKKYIITLTVCIVAALLFGALLMLVTGFNPIEGYSAMIFGALGNARLIGNTIEKAMSLCLLGLATAIGARGGLFNVGGEGQLFFGALISTMLGLWLSDLPAIIVIPIAFIGAVVVGGDMVKIGKGQADPAEAAFNGRVGEDGICGQRQCKYIHHQPDIEIIPQPH